ncbi:uncharacterized protein LOC125778299 [Bactrocera dorsalis]|uniref:Uncharacterized protein LOC125778299 n=1 Tax=Bactrocera dorsalis TaxID=27457 RepID=A0ABM3JPF3_BACDO|nr:uncharacterized protein LOC125778299 [Bactrocera dorsalis]
MQQVYLILFFLTCVATEVQILDYTSSYVITISRGTAKIQQGTFTILHPIDLAQYAMSISNTHTFIQQNIPNHHNLYPILTHELRLTENILENITPTIKNKRAINAIGTIWKYVAGSPDHDDFEIIANNINDLNKNNNKQVYVNEAFNKRLNNLTNMVNKISNAIRKDVLLENEIVINLQNRVRLIKDELINIQNGIEWAKLGIVNPSILDKKEIEIALSKIREENIMFVSPEDALQFAKVSVLYSTNKKIIYLIKVPLTKKETYENIILRPVKKENSIINLEFKRILKNGKTIYGIVNDCENFNNIRICKDDQIKNISDTKCIPNLISGQNSTCVMSNNHHIPLIEEIESGVILLNNYNASIYIDETMRNLSGTFLIKFHNSTIKANNKIFSNIEASPLQMIPALMQPTPFESDRINLLSLEALNELQINNTEVISTIQKHLKIGGWSISVILSLIIVSIACLKFFLRNTKEITVWESQIPRTSLEPHTEIKLSSCIDIPKPIELEAPSKPPRLNNIPFF